MCLCPSYEDSESDAPETESEVEMTDLWRYIPILPNVCPLFHPHLTILTPVFMSFHPHPLLVCFLTRSIRIRINFILPKLQYKQHVTVQFVNMKILYENNVLYDIVLQG